MRGTRAAVVAWGNPERGDDGAAWHVADELRSRLPARSGIRIESFIQLAPELAEMLADLDRVLFVDAHVAPDRAGIEWRRLAPSEDPRLDLSHHMAPGALLALTRAAYGRAPESVLMTVQAHDLSHAAGLSESTARLIPEAVARALEFLEQDGGTDA